MSSQNEYIILALAKLCYFGKKGSLGLQKCINYIVILKHWHKLFMYYL